MHNYKVLTCIKLTLVPQYLCWRVLTGLSDSIVLSFMIVGHTKFTPDSCFGLLKQQFRRTHVETLGDIAEVVKKSGVCNDVEVVGWEDGVVEIPTYDWCSYFAENLKKVSGIKKYQHFSFQKASKGKVLCKEVSDGVEVEYDLLKDPSWKPSVAELPDTVKPKGLNAFRQWYLYEKIRQYCSERSRDTTCPLPSTCRPATPSTPIGSRSPSPSREEDLSDSTQLPPAKKQRICGTCGQSGHNKRTCTNHK